MSEKRWTGVLPSNGSPSPFMEPRNDVNVDDTAKVDVSNMKYWTTFSGYNKDSSSQVTKKQIVESEQLATQLIYNLKKINCNIGVNIDQPINILTEAYIYPYTSSSDGFFAQEFDGYPPMEEIVSPFDGTVYRVVKPNERLDKLTNRFSNPSTSFPIDGNIGFGNASAAAIFPSKTSIPAAILYYNTRDYELKVFNKYGIGNEGGIYRMYLGDVNDPSNYIGMGGGECSFLARRDYSFLIENAPERQGLPTFYVESDSDLAVELGGFTPFDLSEDGFYEDGDFIFYNNEYGYIEKQGMHFVAFIGNALANETTQSLQNTEIIYSDVTGGTNSESFVFTLRIDSFEFFDYE